MYNFNGGYDTSGVNEDAQRLVILYFAYTLILADLKLPNGPPFGV